MGTFENTVKLNSNNILGRIVERVKDKISLEDITTHELTITLDDFKALTTGFYGYKITPPEGTYISEIDANILANRSVTSEASTNISINHGNVNNQITSGSSVIAFFNPPALSLCASSHSYYNPNSKIATGFLTATTNATNATEYANTTAGTSVNRSSYSPNNNGSITILTQEPNLTNITIHIRYKLSKL